MVTLDQVVLLQKKVEAAVEKIKSLDEEIQQLCSENDALRSKCAELTNALKDKTELASTFEEEQKQIEENILKALKHLDAVENSVLYSTQDGDSDEVSSKKDSPDELEIDLPVQQQPQGQSVLKEETQVAENVVPANPQNAPAQKIIDPLAMTFDLPQDEIQKSVSNENPSEQQDGQGLQFEASDEKSDGNQFDIF